MGNTGVSSPRGIRKYRTPTEAQPEMLLLARRVMVVRKGGSGRDMEIGEEL